MGPKVVALIGVLGAAIVALRLPGYVAGFSAMFIVLLVAGNAFGPSFGFLLGAVGMFASGLFVGGLGPWLPFEMVAFGWVGRRRGPAAGRGCAWRVRIPVLAAYGAFAGLAYGAVMNLWTWPFIADGSAIAWDPGGGLALNVRHYTAYYVVSSLGVGPRARDRERGAGARARRAAAACARPRGQADASHDRLRISPRRRRGARRPRPRSRSASPRSCSGRAAAPPAPARRGSAARGRTATDP